MKRKAEEDEPTLPTATRDPITPTEALTELRKLYCEQDIDAYAISNTVKQKLRSEGKYEESVSLTYGEINLLAFDQLLSDIYEATKSVKMLRDPVFIDIGCGVGKTIFVAMLHGDWQFKKCIGIEIVEELHEKCELVKGKMSKVHSKTESIVRFILSDCFKLLQLWTSATMLFVPCTCFTDEMMEKVNQSVKLLQKNTIIITTTRHLEKTPSIALLFDKRYKYSKGSLLFCVYQVL